MAGYGWWEDRIGMGGGSSTSATEWCAEVKKAGSRTAKRKQPDNDLRCYEDAIRTVSVLRPVACCQRTGAVV